MLNVDELDDDVLNNIASRLGFEGKDWDDETKVACVMARIRAMSPTEAFDCFLRWNGIQGWTNQIMTALDSIHAAEEVDAAELVEGIISHNEDL